MAQDHVHVRLPSSLVGQLRAQAQREGIPLSSLIARYCQAGLTAPPSSDLADRVAALEAQIQALWQRDPISLPTTFSPLSASPGALAACEESPPPAQWDPVAHDFDTWLLMVWQRSATDGNGEIRWGFPVSADFIHETGFNVLRKQAFLDRLASSEAPGLHATSWDPEQPHLALVSCRINTVIFYHPDSAEAIPMETLPSQGLNGQSLIEKKQRATSD